MTSPETPAARLTTLVSRFVAGRPLADFARDFAALRESVDPDALPAQQRDILWALADLIELTRPDGTPPYPARRGALTERALRDRLRNFRLAGAEPRAL